MLSGREIWRAYLHAIFRVCSTCTLSCHTKYCARFWLRFQFNETTKYVLTMLASDIAVRVTMVETFEFNVF